MQLFIRLFWLFSHFFNSANRLIKESDGKPAEDRKVSLCFEGWFRGFTSDKFTNYRGEVHFDEDNGHGTIYVDHENVYEDEIAGRMVVYV